MVDQGGNAQQAGLKLGDWIVELDDQLLTRWPHDYVMQLFSKVGGNALRAVVCPPNEAIRAALNLSNVSK